MKQNLKDYIKIHKVFPKKLCKEIIHSLDSSKEEIHTFYKPSQDKSFTLGNDPYKCFIKEGEEGDSICRELMECYRKVIYDYITNLKFHWLINWNGYSFPKILKYNKDTKMNEHCDHIHHIFMDNGKARGIPFLSMITCLNDDYEGGEIKFCQKHTFKLKAGETIVFPSNYLYPHIIKKVKKGVRYTMVSWVY